MADNFETLMLSLGMIAIIAASSIVWGVPGGLFAFGSVFVGWVAWKQFLTAISR